MSHNRGPDEKENWGDLLRGDSTVWLLEEGNPSARYFTLVKLLGQPLDDGAVITARQAIDESEPVLRILNAQRPQGYWGRDKRPYHGVSKHLITLEHLGYGGDDERLHKGIEYLFEHAQMGDGAFTAGELEAGRKWVIPCFTANALHFLHRFGYGDDHRTTRALEYLLRTQRDDGGWLCFERVKKTHACFWATAKALRALEALPAGLLGLTRWWRPLSGRLASSWTTGCTGITASSARSVPAGLSSRGLSSSARTCWRSWSSWRPSSRPTTNGYRKG